MKHLTKTLFFLLISSKLAFASGTDEIPDECKKFTEPPQNSPKIIINEVSFKDDTDWIELYIKDDLGKKMNLRGFSLHDDDEIKRFPDMEVKTGDYVTLTFNSKISDSGKDLFTEKPGLTGTTEQLILKSDYDRIIDIVCWITNDPPQVELNDLEKLKISQNKCVKSAEILNNSSIGLYEDIWKIFAHPTKGKKNEYINNPPSAKISIQTGQTSGPPPLKIDMDASNSHDPDNDEITYKWDFGDNSTSEKENPPSHSYEKFGKYNIELEVTDSLGAIGRDTLKIEVTKSEQETAKLENYPKILISEILPNPDGADTNLEWIELKNPNSLEVDLTDWKIDDEEGGSKPFTIKNLKIPANEYLIIETKLNLNNNEDEVRLFDPNNTIQDEIYYEDAPSGQSLARDIENAWYWSKTPTKGKPNIEMTAPEETEKTEKSEKSDEPESKFENGDMSDEIEITEILPNPDGTDTGNEWIEIHNDSDEKVNLGNWKLDDGEGGSKPYTLSDSLSLEPGEYIVIASKESHINLNNKTDEVRLIAPNNEIIDNTKYTQAPSSMSYARIKLIQNNRLLANLGTPPNTEQENWEWTNAITKGKKNPQYELMQITVSNTEDIDKKRSFKAILNNKEIEIIFEGATLDPKIALATIQEGSIIETQVEKLKNDKYRLKTYNIKTAEQPEIQKTERNLKTGVIIMLISLSAIIILITIHFRKSIKLKELSKLTIISRDIS